MIYYYRLFSLKNLFGLLGHSQYLTKPLVLLAASGSVAAIKFSNLCHCFSEWAEVKAVAWKSSLSFVDKPSLPQDVTLSLYR